MALASAFVAIAAGSATEEGRSARAADHVSVLVRTVPGFAPASELAVRRLGGTVGRRLPIINGFEADVPAAAIERLRRVTAVHSVSMNQRIELLGDGEEDGGDATSWADGDGEGGDEVSIDYVARGAVRASKMWDRGWTGKNVGVAVIDSGVVPVNGLTVSGKVVHGPDLTYESQAANLHYLDTFGHGTHMAGIIAGRDNGIDEIDELEEEDAGAFLGIAPDARIISVKVADAHGATDVSQVIAAIDWVVEHRNDPGLNIRVLNLSFGTDGTQSYLVDPLAYAVEVAWRKGIVVVVAAGNAGFGSAKLNNPAYDPFVIAVGASDTNGTSSVWDDTIPSWSSAGDGTRNPDLVAPGKGIVSLRSPGSQADLSHPNARIKTRLFRGSGTSQAAAVVSGAAALLIQQRPRITPDQLKALITSTASPLPNADPVARGAGLLNLAAARDKRTPSVVQAWQQSTGTGSLHLSRGSARLIDGDKELAGEQDIFGAPWNPTRWTVAAASEASWYGGVWNGNAWSGNAWSGNAWSGNAWSGNAWSGNAWSGNAWSGNAWSGNAWSGNAWSNALWAD